MRAAGEVHREAVLERVPRGRDRAADGAIRALDERRRPREARAAAAPPRRARRRGTGARSRACARAAVRRRSRAAGIEHVVGGHDPSAMTASRSMRVLRDREAMSLRQREGVARRRPERERHRVRASARRATQFRPLARATISLCVRHDLPHRSTVMPLEFIRGLSRRSSTRRSARCRTSRSPASSTRCATRAIATRSCSSSAMAGARRRRRTSPSISARGRRTRADRAVPRPLAHRQRPLDLGAGERPVATRTSSSSS